MRKTILRLGLSALLVLGLGVSARADTIIQYQGPHPIDSSLGRGMCFIEGPHFHSYEPGNTIQFVRVGDDWAFIGDPVEYDPGAPKYGYYGHHPIFWVDAPDAYCSITGPHYHWNAPPPELGFQLKGGVYWYVGKQPDPYKGTPRTELDQYYTTVKVAHPVVTVAPPVGFVGVVVTLPGIYVAPPVLRVETPGVIVVPGGHGWGHGWGHGRGHRGAEWDD